ncbi:hypothetical protein [Paraburkholderia unamae]|uniref:hypothetical protein n=1 Tax=Paraburkholderia unamae TaxID=219649 RepID=UPI001CC801C1|nr:hypothetical protein [Paraburkholderia unamae]
MRIFKFWLIGLALVVIFFALGKILDSIGGYQVERIGLNTKYISITLWLIPLIVTFMVTRYSSRWAGLPGLSYLMLIPVIAVIFNWIDELCGVAVDFSGLSGALVIFKIAFVYSLIPVLVGFMLGIAFKERS